MTRPQNTLILICAGLIVLGVALFFAVARPPESVTIITPPEQTPIGATYINASTSDIVVDLPFPGAVVGKTFSIVGKARGTWYFEASFPAELIDRDGKTLWVGPVTAQEDWMTTDFVPFNTAVTVADQAYIGPATLILRKDNPSGESSRDGSIAFPVTIEY